MPAPKVAGWFAASGAPFAIEAVRRTASDRKGGHFARRTADGRIVLRETAQTPDADKAALADLERHRYCSTNNLWFDLAAMKHALDVRGGILGLPLIRNVKHVDPGDPKSPEVVQVETAMGAAIEVFEGALTICVDRDRFVPVKTTDDLLVLRSDVYEIGRRLRARPVGRAGAVRRARRPPLQARRRVRQAVPRGGAVAARGAEPHRRGRLDLRQGRPGRGRRRARGPARPQRVAPGTVLDEGLSDG